MWRVGLLPLSPQVREVNLGGPPHLLDILLDVLKSSFSMGGTEPLLSPFSIQHVEQSIRKRGKRSYAQKKDLAGAIPSPPLKRARP